MQSAKKSAYAGYSQESQARKGDAYMLPADFNTFQCIESLKQSAQTLQNSSLSKMQPKAATITTTDS